MFYFKQFSVDQTGCAMKINTDGVLLGALAEADQPSSILDIGTGTGVIALMLAQRFSSAKIDAVEVDEAAAKTAERNFKNSPFDDRLNVCPMGFEDYFNQHPDRKYDLIVSNPPFYIDSLKSPKGKINLAKHAETDFFEALVTASSIKLCPDGCIWLILPVNTAGLVIELAAAAGLHLHKILRVRSFENTGAHRQILCFGFEEIKNETTTFTIYKADKIYSEEYRSLLQPYFIAF